jgi:hypothetical protein
LEYTNHVILLDCPFPLQSLSTPMLFARITIAEKKTV